MGARFSAERIGSDPGPDIAPRNHLPPATLASGYGSFAATSSDCDGFAVAFGVRGRAHWASDSAVTSIGQTIATVKGRPNTVLELSDRNVVVATSRSPLGTRSGRLGSSGARLSPGHWRRPLRPEVLPETGWLEPAPRSQIMAVSGALHRTVVTNDGREHS